MDFIKNGVLLRIVLKTSFVLILVFSCNSQLLAQYTFEQITKNQGLSHNNVESILEDSDGFMWFGTRDGLCRFDGYEMKVYRNTSDPNSISGNRILSVAEDKNGMLWVATYQNGLNKFNKKKNIFVHYGSDYGIGNQVYKIEVLKDGTVLVGSSNGLAVFDSQKDTFTIYTPTYTEYGINSHIISDILETREGQIYIATWENDIQKFDKESGKFYSIFYNPLNRIVVNYRKRLLEDLKGNIWISAQMHGLASYNPKTQQTKFYYQGPKGLNTDVLNGDMILSPEGNIWLATDVGGINIFNTKEERFEYITHHDDKTSSLSSNHIYTLYVDKSNRIWVGTFDKGVAYYDPLMNKFRNTSWPDDLYSFFSSKSVLSLFQDSNENIWIGTDGQGLHSVDRNFKLKSYYHSDKDVNSLSSNVITSLGEDILGNILIGTYAGGLNVYNPQKKRFKHYKNDPNNNKALHSENVWTLITDSQGQNWLGLLGNGADIFDSKRGSFKNIGPYSNELSKIGHPNVMSIMEDADGDIWFGTEGDGIYVFDKQAGKVLRIVTNPSSNVVTKGVIKDMFQDSQGEIWIATEGNGLFKYNEGTKKLNHFTTKEGLPGMIILGINEDNAGSIWVSTYDGLAIFKKSAGVFSAFSKDDGLSSNEFNAEAFIKLSNGSFLVGSNNGIDIFDPLEIRFNQNLPKVLFTHLSVLNKEVLPGDTINNRVILENDFSVTKEITIQYEDKIFAIEFAALNFTQPQKCQYKYMLEGFDEDWIYTTFDHRFASYSNLQNGDYVFKVQASNNDGKWGNNTAELKIKILPPFWRTVWFKTLVFLLLFGVLALIYLSRLRSIKNKFIRDEAHHKNRILELEKENIESELEKLTYYTVNRNRVLINYKNRLHSLSVKAKESVKKGLQVVITEIDKEISDDKEWKYIEPRLDKFYNNFITILKETHPDLTLSEIKVATYVRMDLTSKEISEFMNKTIRAVENDRYRLRKKINLESNDSLQNYLLNL